MADIDSEIAELERQLFEKKAALAKSKAHKAWKVEDAAFVSCSEEMRLDLLSDLVTIIIDNIPVQVFIKEAKFVPERGRRYIYLNAAAKKILGWEDVDITQKYDSDAIRGGFDSIEYKKMQNQENECLLSLKSRWKYLEWTAQADGSGWRRNKTLEIPIFDSGHQVIGFCAVAEDIEFRHLPSIHTWLRTVFEHEYNNAAGQIFLQLEYIEKRLKEFLVAQGDTAQNDPHVRDLTGKCRSHLSIIDRRLQISSRVSNALINAFANIPMSRKLTVAEVASKLCEIYRNPPFNMMIEYDPAAGLTKIRKPSAVIGVIVELIQNAIKHSGDHPNGDFEVRVKAETRNGGTTWVISNKPETFEGRLNIVQIIEPLGVRTRNLGGLVISDILSRSFPSENVIKMIDFPESLDTDGWVHVCFHCSEEADV